MSIKINFQEQFHTAVEKKEVKREIIKLNYDG